MWTLKSCAVPTFVVVFVTFVALLHFHHDVQTLVTEPRSVQQTKIQRHVSRRQERESMWNEIVDKRKNIAREERVSDVIGIGVKKCGTGALIHFLGQHPLIKLPAKVETFFFNVRYSRGLEYYKKLLPLAGNHELVMEKTPSYFYSADKVISRIRRDLPKVKLILSLCNPINRAFSDFVHTNYHRNEEDDKHHFAKAFDQAADRYIAMFSDPKKNHFENAEAAQTACWRNGEACIFSKGMYHYNTQKWLKSFPDSQILILNGDNWIADPGSLIELVQDFLAIPKLLLREDFIKSPETGFYCLNRWWNETHKEGLSKRAESISELDDEGLFCLRPGKGRTRNGVRVMFPETYQKLKRFYEPHNALFYKLLNRDMEW